ncbi:MAG: WhiB family transcriptional regulator [Egibacteraceae bacterium]
MRYVPFRRAARCRKRDAMRFVTGRALEQTREAKQVCAGCPVRSQCLDWALATNQQDGVWGGLSEDERRPATG